MPGLPAEIRHQENHPPGIQGNPQDLKGSDVLTVGTGDMLVDPRLYRRLIGMNVGDNKSVDCQFPEDYPKDDARGPTRQR
jgi:hypothetical protein